MCEEFHCVPSVALREWQRAPSELLEHLIEARAYAHAKGQYDSATTAEAVKRLPASDLMKLVKRIDFELAHEAIDARRPADH